MSMQEVLDYLDGHQDEHLRQLCDFLKIPSISTQPEYAADIRRAVDFLKGELDALGLNPEVIETEGHPLVYAQTEQRKGLPTLLIYGHYDVQPADPIELWDKWNIKIASSESLN